MKTLTKLSFWTLLPLLLLGIPARSLADVTVQTETLVSRLKQQTQVPIFIPTFVPGPDKIYVWLDEPVPGVEGYYLSYNHRPECRGETYCRWGSLEANRGQKLYSEPSTQAVTLINGVRGLYTFARGPYRTALVTWMYKGVLYKAGIKNGLKEDALAFANSAIVAGPKTPAQQRSATRLTPGMRAMLTSEQPGTPINVRDGASIKTYARHIGYAGDSIKILAQRVSSDGVTWYRVKFAASGATGWVRGDFVALNFHNSH